MDEWNRGSWSGLIDSGLEHKELVSASIGGGAVQGASQATYQ